MLMPKREPEPEDDKPSGKGDLARVLSLPVINPLDGPDMTDDLLLPGKQAWPGRLKPVQSAALRQATTLGGLLAPIGVGHGKTLVSALLPTVLGAKLAVLLVPAQLVGKTERELAKLRQYWRILPPGQLRIISYNKLSLQSSSALLEDLGPDLIIADEAHNLKTGTSARTKRFLRYFKLHPATKFCALSGTMTQKSLYDYWHLAKLALHDASPVPLNWPEVGVWDVVFGVTTDQERYAAAASGARMAVPSSESRGVGIKFIRWVMSQGQGGDVAKLAVPDPRDAFAQRLTTCPGVVATHNAECDASLQINLVEKALVPAEVRAALDQLDATWELGDEEISDALTMSRVRRQIASGFYYRWVWPNDIKDEEWLEARRGWRKAVRYFLAGKATTNYDSPALLAAAAERRDARVQKLWAPWETWKAVKHRPEPPTETVWISEYLVDRAIEVAETGGGPCLVYYDSRAIEMAFRRRGLPVYGGGADSGKLVELALAFDAGKAPPPVVCCSIAAQGTGKNLQAWQRMVVAQPPSSGVVWEQLIGRIHRQGQRADQVDVTVMTHLEPFANAWESALRDAEYQQATLQQPQRILFADLVTV